LLEETLCDNVGWGMVEAFHTIVMQTMMFALDKVNVFVLSYDEVTSIDN
jgi:hypothetical protein